tara:strand:- start:261 stop:668 length:408 start_codon:yes stop_codon:yes gene_type:complete
VSEYDNNNRGAVFQPFDDQKFILQGKLDIEGKEYPVVVMQMTSKNGNKRLEIYQKMGAMFAETDKTNEKAPDYSGPMDLIEGNLRVAGWKEEKNGNHYLSLQVSESQSKKDNVTELKPAIDKEVIEALAEDSIPF